MQGFPLRRLSVVMSVLSPLLLACTGSADRAARTDSTMGSATQVDSSATHPPIAIDATLTLQVPSYLIEKLRVVSDSFGSREAVLVVLADLSDSSDTTTARPINFSSEADIVVLPGHLLARVPSDSLPWLLPFAEVVGTAVDSAANADSAHRSPAGRGATPRRRSTRRSSGRRADSLRADSVRRDSLRQDNLRASRLRADSARTLVLTIPSHAPNSGVAERFVRYLLTEGRTTLLRSGLRVLPRLIVRGGDAPLGIRAIVDSIVPRADSATDGLLPRGVSVRDTVPPR